MILVLVNTLLESAPYIVLGFLIAGIIRYQVPRRSLQYHLGGSRKSSLFKSVGIGCLLPMCSCGTIPLGIGMYRNGASTGNMLAFMTSTPVLSPVLVIISLQFLGVKITLVLLAAAISGAMITGYLGNHFFRNGRSPKREAEINFQDEKSLKEPGNKITRILNWSFLKLGADVSVDILIGLTIASLLLTVLPLDWISTWLGQQKLSTLLYVILLGIPVYACSIPSIPVVQGLLLLGVTPGAAIAYLVAGPATNLGELNAIRKSMGLKPALFYMIMLVFMAVSAGLITDQLIFPDYQYHAYRMQGELVVQQCCVPLIFGDSIGGIQAGITAPAWHVPFGLILFGVLMAGIYKKTKFFFINPCSVCSWKTYSSSNRCGSRCHVRRKYEFFRKIKLLFRRSGARSPLRVPRFYGQEIKHKSR